MGIGVDIGGTGVRASSVDGDSIRAIHSVRTTDRSVDGVLATLAHLLSDLPAGPVGIAMPGFVADGIVCASPNFPAWRDVDLARLASDRLQRHVVVANDADCAALGASVMLGCPDLLALTIGTGVGGGRVVDGSLAPSRYGAEFGHLASGGDVRCGCGATGCLETRASLSAVQRVAATLQLSGTPTDWPADHPVWSDFQQALADGLRSLVNAFGPRAVALLGGGAGPAVLPAITQFRASVIEVHRAIPVHVMGRADEAAIRGAATLTEAE